MLFLRLLAIILCFLQFLINKTKVFFLFRIENVTALQEEFIKNLKFYRNKLDISQEKLAESCNCATGTIGCIECGKTLPSFEMIDKISKALKIHPADLFLRNASNTVSNTKSILRTELLPQIERFIDMKL